MGICCMGVLPQGRSVIARFVLGEDGMTERACPFPARAKRQRERVTGGRPIVAPTMLLFVESARNWRAAYMPPLRIPVCCIDEEHEGGTPAVGTFPAPTKASPTEGKYQQESRNPLFGFRRP